jgi:SAM-dependent methyltransferase
MLSRRRPSPGAPHPPAAPVPWPDESFTGAAGQIISFFGDEGIDLCGTRLADIGCGDGVTDLGVFLRADPAVLVGFDLTPVDTASLAARAAAEGVATSLPHGLRFETCGPEHLPAEDDSFDHVFSWSAFEHVVRPNAVLRDVHRILRPGGTLMIQLWPFYHSKHGSHLWDWFPDGFPQLLHDPFEIERRVLAEPDKGPGWTVELLRAFRELNRITLDDLHRALLYARFTVTKLELLHEPFHVAPELSHLPLSLLAIAGVKLLAVPR